MDNIKEKYEAPHLNGQQERSGLGGEGVTSRGVDVGSGSLLLCRFGDDCNSWSHMCGSWYLPMLQLRGGS